MIACHLITLTDVNMNGLAVAATALGSLPGR